MVTETTENKNTSKLKLLCIVEVPEGERGAENLLKEIMSEIFSNLGKEIDNQIQKSNEFQIR